MDRYSWGLLSDKWAVFWKCANTAAPISPWDIYIRNPDNIAQVSGRSCHWGIKMQDQKYPSSSVCVILLPLVHQCALKHSRSHYQNSELCCRRNRSESDSPPSCLVLREIKSGRCWTKMCCGDVRVCSSGSSHPAILWVVSDAAP